MILNDVYNSLNDPGLYQYIGEFTDTLPSGGYKLVMNIDEPDSSYSFEQNVLETYQGYAPSLLNKKENAVTENGIFKINYDDIPFDVEFIRTIEFSP